MIEVYKKILKNKSLEKINSFEKDSWIKVIDPSQEEIEKLTKELNLEKEHFIDGLDVNETPRIEQENNGLYIFLRYPTKTISGQATSTLLTIITPKHFITISKTKPEFFDSIISGKIPFYTNQPSRNLMKILFLITRFYENSVRAMYKEVKQERKKEINRTS